MILLKYTSNVFVVGKWSMLWVLKDGSDHHSCFGIESPVFHCCTLSPFQLLQFGWQIVWSSYQRSCSVVSLQLLNFPVLDHLNGLMPTQSVLTREHCLARRLMSLSYQLVALLNILLTGLAFFQSHQFSRRSIMVLLQSVALTMPAAYLESPCAFFGSGSAGLAFCRHLSLVLPSLGNVFPIGALFVLPESTPFLHIPVLLTMFLLPFFIGIRLSCGHQLYSHLIGKLFLVGYTRKILKMSIKTLASGSHSLVIQWTQHKYFHEEWSFAHVVKVPPNPNVLT